MKRSPRSLPPERVRELEREARRIDQDEAEAIRRKGRAIKARHDQLRNVAKILKAERERLGLSLAQVAERSGIAKANLSRLENDPHPNPTIDTLLRYADAIGSRIEIRLGPGSSNAA
jgi:DNA-binding XRE family transcriptional regulator